MSGTGKSGKMVRFESDLDVDNSSVNAVVRILFGLENYSPLLRAVLSESNKDVAKCSSAEYISVTDAEFID